MRWTKCIWKVRRYKPTPTWQLKLQEKTPDAWEGSWEKLHLLILEFTRPNDKGELSIHGTDLYKTARYKSLGTS
jgi:hypothetical protein